MMKIRIVVLLGLGLMQGNIAWAQENAADKKEFNKVTFLNEFRVISDTESSTDAIENAKLNLVRSILDYPDQATYFIGVTKFDIGPYGNERFVNAAKYLAGRLENAGPGNKSAITAVLKTLIETQNKMDTGALKDLSIGKRNESLPYRLLGEALRQLEEGYRRLESGKENSARFNSASAILSTVLDAGVDPNAEVRSGFDRYSDGDRRLLTSVLTYADMKHPRMVGIIQQLLHKGASPELEDSAGTTPLMAIRARLALAKDNLTRCDADDRQDRCEAAVEISNCEAILELLEKTIKLRAEGGKNPPVEAQMANLLNRLDRYEEVIGRALSPDHGDELLRAVDWHLGRLGQFLSSAPKDSDDMRKFQNGAKNLVMVVDGIQKLITEARVNVEKEMEVKSTAESATPQVPKK